MDDKLFKRVLFSLLIIGVISVIVLLIITIVLYNQTSMITFIEKEIW
jgi:hypothetical protein